MMSWSHHYKLGIQLGRSNKISASKSVSRKRARTYDVMCFRCALDGIKALHHEFETCSQLAFVYGLWSIARSIREVLVQPTAQISTDAVEARNGTTQEQKKASA